MANNEVIELIKQSFELKNQGYYKQAIELLYKALAIESENVEIFSQLAELYYLLENNQRAIDYIEKTLEFKPKHIEALNLLKSIQVSEKKYKEALDTINKIFDIESSQEMLAEKIKILINLNDYEGIKVLENSNFEFNDSVLFGFANVYYNEQDFEKAVQLLEKAKSKNPDNINVLNLLAQIYFETEQAEKAKDLFLKLEEVEPNASVMNCLGLYYLEELNFTEAIKYFDKAFKKDSKNGCYAFNLANAYFLNGWINEAIKVFNLALCLDENNCDYRYALAYLYFKEQRYDNALKEIQSIFQIDSEYLQAKILSSLIKFKKGNAIVARVELEKLFDNNCENEFLLSSLAEVYKSLELNEKAEIILQKTVELKPESIKNLTEYIEVLILNSKFEQAKEALGNLMKNYPNYIEAYILLAKVYEGLQDFEKVFDIAQKIIELDSNKSEGYYFNALALFEQEDVSFAIETLKKAISLDVNNAILYVRMSEFYQAIGEYENALEYIKEASNIDKSTKNRELYMKLAAIVRRTRTTILPG